MKIAQVALMVLALQSIGFSSVNAYDPTPPSVVSVMVSPNSLPESGGDVTVTVAISSVNGLVGNPVGGLYLQSDKSHNEGFVVMTEISGDSHNGTFQTTVHFTSADKPGRYSLTLFPLQDLDKNTTTGFLTPLTLMLI